MTKEKKQEGKKGKYKKIRGEMKKKVRSEMKKVFIIRIKMERYFLKEDLEKLHPQKII